MIEHSEYNIFLPATVQESGTTSVSETIRP